LYSTPNTVIVTKSTRMIEGYVTRKTEKRNSYTIFVRKLEGKRPCRRPKHTWEDNIRMVLR